MALRIPRGYAVNRPYFREVSEGVRPNSQAAPRLPHSGLAHVRVDEVHHDPIVIDAGTIIGVVTGLTGATGQYGVFSAGASGSFVPAMMRTGNIPVTNISTSIDSQMLVNLGSTEATTTWGMAGPSGALLIGEVKPIGVVSQPVYSSYLTTAFTNYKRQHSLGFVTQYVIQVPATNVEETIINAGDVVMLGSGFHYGIGTTDFYDAQRQAGRYAKFNSDAYKAQERIIGRCLKKTFIGTGGSSTSVGGLLKDGLSDFTAASDLAAEFAGLERVQTVPGLTLSGAETKGVPTFLLGARADANKRYWALTILVRM
jgi:hypothetical protein